MRRPLLVLPLLLAGCGLLDSKEGASTGPGPGASTPTTALAQAAVAATNDVRSHASPTPSPALPEVGWSDSVAAVAQAWASNCRYQHNAGRGDLGENIAASSPGYWPTIAGVVQAWADEKADYDYAKDACADGKECGHYTQLVWRSSTLIGCAYARCTTNSPFGSGYPTWDFWVCDYSPPGNWIGRRPY